MECITYIADGQTLVNNIHFIKKCVYHGLIRVHIPACAIETAEKLYQKSLEPKEVPKNSQPKRWSGRIRREQQPLFDINPRTTTEFLERAGSEKGVAGVTLQSENEEFSQWKAEHEKTAKSEEEHVAAPTSFSEALLRKLNIKDTDEKPDDTSSKPKLVAKAANGSSSTFRYQKIPSVPLTDIPQDLQPLFSCALWRMHDYENNPLHPEKYALLLQNQSMLVLAHSIGLPAVSPSTLRNSIAAELSRLDNRDAAGELETEFPDAPRREIPILRKRALVDSSITADGASAQTDEAEKALEAVALSVVQGLDQPEGLDIKSEQQLTKVLAAELRPSVSYAMAAGSTAATPAKPSSLSPQQQAVDTSEKLEIQEPETPVLDVKKTASPESKRVDAADGASDSDEEVVVFNPKARQAAQANKKRRSHDMPLSNSRSISRPATANGMADLPKSPRPSSAILNSILKPQSPVFSPRPAYVTSSPAMNSSNLASPTFPITSGTPPRKASPPERVSTSSPQTNAKQLPHGSRQARPTGQSRPPSREAAQRQSELILQRQREAIKRSAQVQDAKTTHASKEAANKPAPREIDMRPTSNPVVIDPDDFGRDYTIRPGSHAESNAKPRGEGRGRRGGRGRGKQQQYQQQQPQPPPTPQKQQQPQQQHQQQQQEQQQQQAQRTQGARGADVDFVLKSGNPRGAARGTGRLWVP